MHDKDVATLVIKMPLVHTLLSMTLFSQQISKSSFNIRFAFVFHPSFSMSICKIYEKILPVNFILVGDHFPLAERGGPIIKNKMPGDKIGVGVGAELLTQW